MWALLLDDVPHFVPVLRRQKHSNVTTVTDAGYAFEKFRLGELFWECEKSSPNCRRQVDLLGESDSRVVFDDPDWLVHPPGKI